MVGNMHDPAHSLPQLLTPLSGLSVGWWLSRKHKNIWLLILQQQQRFIFLVEKAPKTQRGSNFVVKTLGDHSPFTSKSAAERGWVCAFETEFDAIVGLDYVLPLVRPGRLVLEARRVRKREFASMEQACRYYGADGIGAPAVPLEGVEPGSPMAISVPRNDSPARHKAAAAPAGALPGGRARSNLMQRLRGAAQRAASPHREAGEDGPTFRPGVEGGGKGGGNEADTPTLADAARHSGEFCSSGRARAAEPRLSGSDAAGATLLGSTRSLSLRLPSDDALLPPPALAPAASGEPHRGSHPAADAVVFDFRQITAFWEDPHLPAALAPSFMANERLLKLLESGLPAWAIFMPAYGLWYRPWLRTLTWVLFYAFSFFSLTAGFYDLFKTLPGLQLVLRQLLSGLWLPPAAVLQWIEEHAQVRLSILLTYLFGKSQMAVYIVRMAGSAARVARGAAQPLVDALGPPLGALGAALTACGGTMAAFLHAGLSPIGAVLVATWQNVAALLAPLLLMVRACVALPAAWAVVAVQRAQAVLGVLWGGLAGACRGVAAGAAVVKATADASRGAAVGAAGSSSWLMWRELGRGSVGRAARSAHPVWRFMMQVGSGVVRHRLTLSRRAGRAWRRAKARAGRVAWTPMACALALLQWLVGAARALPLLLHSFAKGCRESVEEPALPRPEEGQEAHGAGAGAAVRPALEVAPPADERQRKKAQ